MTLSSRPFSLLLSLVWEFISPVNADHKNSLTEGRGGEGIREEAERKHTKSDLCLPLLKHQPTHESCFQPAELKAQNL